MGAYTFLALSSPQLCLHQRALLPVPRSTYIVPNASWCTGGPNQGEEPGASDSDDDSAAGGPDAGAAEQRDGAADEGVWQKAARSAAAARRARRKQMRWERRQAQAQALEAEQEPPAAEPGPAGPAEEQVRIGAAERGSEYKAGHQEDSSQGETGSSSDEAGAGGSVDGGASVQGESSVACVTGDFAMQNVLLQMGLRLVAPNGSRIRELRRWALRCSACSRVTKVQRPASRTTCMSAPAWCFAFTGLGVACVLRWQQKGFWAYESSAESLFVTASSGQSGKRWLKV